MLEMLSSIVGILGWLVTGLWMLRGWHVRREDKPRINLNASLREIIARDGKRIVEIVAEVENTGEVRHVFKDMTYTLHGSDLSSIEEEPELLGQVYLPIKLATKQRFFPTSWEYSFVDAGQVSRYRSLVSIPEGVKLLKLGVIMSYGDRESDFHSAVWYGVVGVVSTRSNVDTF
jgi:hypothetical protein